MRREWPLGTSPVRGVLAVNGKFLSALACGFIAWVSWPDGPEHWQAAIIALITAPAAVGFTIAAVVMMVRIYIRDRQLAAMLARGRVARPAEMAGRDALRRAGMTDD